MTSTEYRSGQFRLKLAERELWRGEALLPVNRIVFECMAYLIEHRARAVGRDELVSAVWGRVDVADVHLNQAVARARRALGDDAQSQHMIRTVHGFGYRWVGEVVENEAAVPDVPAPLPAQVLPTPTAIADPMPPPPAAAPRKRRRLVWRVAAATLVLALVGALLLRPVPVPDADEPRAGIAVVVLPLVVDGPDDASWVALGAMDLIAARLRRAALPVPPSETVVTALHGLQSPPGAADLQRVRETLGAGLVVQGTASRSGEAWTVTLVANGADDVQQRAQATNADAIRAARAAADLLLAGLGHAPPPGDADTGTDPAQERLQQVQAAVLTSQLDLARTLLLAMPDDPRTAMEVRYRLADVDIRAGRAEQAGVAIAALLDDPRIQTDALLRGRVLILRGNLNFRRSAFADAGVDFDAAIALLTPLAAPLDLADALTRRGLIRTGLGEFEDASANFGQARLLAEQAGDRLRVAHAEAGFGMMQIERRRLDLALPYLDAAIAQYEAFGVVDRVITLRNVLNDAYAALLRWPEVRALDERQWPLVAQAGDPGLALVIVNRRGRLLIAQGEYAAARTLIADARTRYADVRPAALRYLHDSQADLASHEGRFADAVAAVDQALETWPRNPGFDRYAYLLLLRQRAAWASGQPAAAPDAAGAPEQGTRVSAIYRVVQAEWAAHQGDQAAAAREFTAAMQEAEAIGTPALVALVAQSYADWLLARGDTEQAAVLAGRVAVWAPQDFDCALLRVKVFHALGKRDTWRLALEQAQRLAGERVIAAALLAPPAR